jgi:hypothetical protein
MKNKKNKRKIRKIQEKHFLCKTSNILFSDLLAETFNFRIHILYFFANIKNLLNRKKQKKVA